MTRYSFQPRDGIFVKGYIFLSFARNIGKNISKDLSSKYSQKLLDHAKQSATNAFQTPSKRAIQKTAEATGDLIGKKLLIKLHESQKLQHRIIQLQMKNKFLKKDIYLQTINIIMYNIIMEYQKIINLLDDTTNEPSKKGTTNWVEINVESRWTYNANNDINFKTSKR